MSALGCRVVESDDGTRRSAGEKRRSSRIVAGDQNNRSGSKPTRQVVLRGRRPLDYSPMAEEKCLSLALVEVASIDASERDRRQSYVLERLPKAEYRIDGQTETSVGHVRAGKQHGRRRETVVSLESRVVNPSAGCQRCIRGKACEVDWGGQDCRATGKPPIALLDAGCVTNRRNGDDVGLVSEPERSSIQFAERRCRQIDDDRSVRMLLPEILHAREAVVVDVIDVGFRFG
jgi:hypothetical protein